MRAYDADNRLNALERLANDLTVKFSVLSQKVSKISDSMSELKVFSVNMATTNQANLTESFDGLLTVLEGLDEQVQGMRSELKRQDPDLQYNEYRRQSDQAAVTPVIKEHDKHLLETKSVTERNKVKTHKPVQQPPKYDGKSSWEAFLAQFEIAAQMNDWADEEKAAFLATSLAGNATLVLSNLSNQDRRDYHVLVAALTSRIGVTHQAELARAKLKNRLRRKGETLPELVECVESLTRTAYPDATSELQDVLGRDHFIDALSDEDLRLRIRQAKPRSLSSDLKFVRLSPGWKPHQRNLHGSRYHPLVLVSKRIGISGNR